MTLEPQFLYLGTVGWKTGKPHEIEIWFVKHSGQYYVMSEHHQRSHWVQNIIRNPRVSFTVGNKKFRGTARTIDRQKEPQLAIEVSRLMADKYQWYGGLIVEVKPAEG